MRLSASQLAVLERLGKSPDGLQLRLLISEEIEECNGRLRKLEGSALLREQGRATYLDELLRHLSPPSSQQVPRVPSPSSTSER